MKVCDKNGVSWGDGGCAFCRKQSQDCLMLLGGFGIATRLHQAALRLNACFLASGEDKFYGQTGRTE